jgi:DNA polymerase III gamma/tau subunit
MSSSQSAHLANVALYRKYRPHSFADVVGQDHIVKVLEGSVTTGRISHAYLFAGSRGTGKTSIARIFARALGTSENDIYEIDAASNRGIDDVRAIRDAVAVMPLESRYKVYIVDEAHMLTKEAFNALLKTLEEPPAHVIFILATTELDKLPDTVVSRCQSFSFKKAARDILRDVVTAVAKKEGFVLEPGAADLLALLGDGSFRDALGMLDKVLSSQVGKDDTSKEKKIEGKSEKKVSQSILQSISLEQIELITGAPRNSLVNDFLTGLSKSDPSPALAAVSKADAVGIDMKIFLALVLEKARFILLLKNSGNTPAGFSNPTAKDIEQRLSADDFKLMQTLAREAQATNKVFTSATLAELLHAYDEVGRAHIPSLPIELAVIKITSSKELPLNNS